MPRSDEEILYRSHVPEGIISADVSTRDEDNFDTLKAVYLTLKAAVDDLDRWHAFDLAERDGLDIKQQILAARIAFDTLIPVLSSIESAIAVVNDKYKDR